jgi:SAM-dependent methyltransferase
VHAARVAYTERVSITQRVKSVARPAVLSGVRRILPGVAPSMMQLGHFWPHAYTAQSYARPTTDRGPLGPAAGADLPVPPEDFWAYYCTDAASFLESGRQDVGTMREIITSHGGSLDVERVLDLGVAGGRMIRWMTDLAEGGAQVWGADIWASAILWCQDNLHPPCHFAVTTMSPTLPFEDRSFDLIYCGSLFTHIDDLAESWFAELHRIIKPGGHLYFSINDRHAVKIFDGQGDPDAYAAYYERSGGKVLWDQFIDTVNADPEYQRFRRGDAYMVTIGRSMTSHVMWDTDVLSSRLSYGFRTKAVTPASYGHQTTVLLERI